MLCNPVARNSLSYINSTSMISWKLYTYLKLVNAFNVCLKVKKIKTLNIWSKKTPLSLLWYIIVDYYDFRCDYMPIFHNIRPSSSDFKRLDILFIILFILLRIFYTIGIRVITVHNVNLYKRHMVNYILDRNIYLPPINLQ